MKSSVFRLTALIIVIFHKEVKGIIMSINPPPLVMDPKRFYRSGVECVCLPFRKAPLVQEVNNARMAEALPCQMGL